MSASLTLSKDVPADALAAASAGNGEGDTGGVCAHATAAHAPISRAAVESLVTIVLGKRAMLDIH
jgi:hypothetical protein